MAVLGSHELKDGRAIDDGLLPRLERFSLFGLAEYNVEIPANGIADPANGVERQVDLTRQLPAELGELHLCGLRDHRSCLVSLGDNDSEVRGNGGFATASPVSRICPQLFECLGKRYTYALLALSAPA
ncbi:MAG TPA: hypothetical protein PLO41_00370 [Rubrivivax sp.]|nr:hypothetical protein [Rubrivivax sp.]